MYGICNNEIRTVSESGSAFPDLCNVTRDDAPYVPVGLGGVCASYFMKVISYHGR